MNSAQEEVKEDSRIGARKVLNQHFYGVLSTHSKKFPGYPFGSVVPYCLNSEGIPLILISRLAQHTQNIQESSKVSLVILDRTEGNVQTDARLTMVAHAEKVPSTNVEASSERYYSHFPAAQGYHTELDFEFYTLRIEAMRYIPGFGQARWVSASEVLLPNPFSNSEEARIVGHMNEDHRDALLHYCQTSPIKDKNDTSTLDASQITMVGIDAEGIALRVNDDLHRIIFPTAVVNPLEARQMLVEMAK